MAIALAARRMGSARNWRAALLGAVGALTVTSLHAHETASIEHAIEMSRIQHEVTADGTVAAFSPDGKRFATIVWRGDLSRNANLYSLLVFDLTGGENGHRAPHTLLTWEFVGDPVDQKASAFEQVTFLPDNRSIAFLGRKDNGPRQVYSVDIQTGRLRQLTRHPSDVKSFAIAADGTARIFSSIIDADEHGARREAYDQDGVFLWDSRLFAFNESFRAGAALSPQPRWARQYLMQVGTNATPIFDSRQSRPKTPAVTEHERDRGFSLQLHDEEMLRRWSSLTGDTRGRYALLFPYAVAEQPLDTTRFAHYRTADGKLDAPYALIDLATGRLRTFIDAPHPYSGKGNGKPAWAPDGRSVAIFTLLPPGTFEGSAQQPPQWVRVEIATGKITPLNVPPGWQVSSWNAAGTQLVLYDKYMGFAMLRPDANGRWGDFKRIDAASRINPMWKPATNGQLAIGVKDTTYSPPELVAVDLATGGTTVLTDLNPALRKLRYAPVEVLRWSHRYDPDASGFLIKPVDFEKGRRYPLVVLLDDATLKGTTDPYLLDAAFQLNGHAIQALAADGFMVLYTREPRMLFDDSDGSQEGQRITEHVEAAIAALERQEFIDPQRLGLSGWSRAAYHTDCILMRSSRRFAAASKMDGGSWQYVPQMRPFTDDELLSIRTPMLFEAHGLLSLARMTGMVDRMEAFGKPSEVLYFATAPHSTVRPRHRLTSLQTHLDWWRFWLRGYEDADPRKAQLYQRWRAMRATWDAAQRLTKQANSPADLPIPQN